jgi:sirohydrochlorin ferrochelatase
MDVVAIRRPNLDVRLAYVDVQHPRIATAVTDDAVVVPLLLSTGYHVLVDVAEAVAGTGALVSAPLGPDPRLVEVLADRITEPTDAVVLAAAGSSEPRSRADVVSVAEQLNADVGYAAGSGPLVPDVVVALRRAGADHVTIVTYLLADGLFYRTLRRAGADLVTAPLVTSPVIADLVLSRFLTIGDVTLTEDVHGGVTP